MKKFLVTGFVALLALCHHVQAQSYQLSGNPVNTAGWSLVPSATVNTDFIQLTADQISQVGGIKLDDPINLKYCDKWKVEFDFRIDGNGTTSYGRGDGFAFWYLANPPASYVQGGGLGIPSNASGLMVAFDIFNNSSEGQMSKVHVLYGTNNLPAGNNNIEYNNTPNSSFHTPDLISTIPFVGSTYRHVEVNGEVDPNNIANWIITIKIDNNTVVNQSFAPSGGAATMTQGYFGFSASTGAASARHSIKNVKVYVDKVPLLQETVTPSETCPNALTGVVTTDLTSFTSQFVNNPANYTFAYVVNGTPVTNPANYQFSANTTVNVIVKDNSGTFCDNPDAKIILTPQPVNKTDVTLFSCPMNGQAVFDLTQANVTTQTNVTKQYYRTLADLNAGTNEITNPATFSSVEGEVYVKINTSTGCTAIAKITLKHYPVPTVNDVTIRTCFNMNNVSTGTFNLTVAAVTTETGITKKYFTNYNDALAEINEITNPLAYISANGAAYIKVINSNGCGSIAKVTLNVIPPVYSTILKDQIICIENTTTLDAGSGFTSYLWSTGATTQSITNIGVGTYWVDLKTGDCILRQEVKVIPSESPVIKEIHLEGNTAAVEVKGGRAPYQYSLDGIKWQESNVFSNLIRGENTFYVKDFYNCDPVVVTVTVPNLVNVITPNGDGYNDTINYSELGYKKNLSFTIYDRYGNKIFEGTSFNNYTWDGTIQGRKVPTQTYWYHLTWDEPSKDKPQIKFTGWILMKNRD
ncbi:T9SS type B sorting domain-containing protein [Chryseobacterium sp. MYb264]|uniref:T9SS type B sorting domain-containing protein n=1 Tax=Chryseobacterium sp. MYb264 TaxID=2745153 RepID=UPI002E0D9FB0|nr:T9SS type B sorting domain-containing protein [Chryseobacterium sp. MYb264]